MTDRIYCIQTDCQNTDCDKNLSNHEQVKKPLSERYVNDQVADVMVKNFECEEKAE